ncbi:MAG: mitochondrial fission ELM1 family protein [Candidatus Omnitrophica bacterium]|nr:mitochondrial fission ELM1 family protein [Candidatus Omnitrophota bacterium]MCM8826270.1 mitochondrial fission ELM1 family protein [Candidatus Omnitrophota bacterium]
MYSLIKITIRILKILPLGLLVFLGRVIGVLFYCFSSKKRFTAYRNLKLAFPYKSSKEIFLIIKRSFTNFGIMIMENLAFEKFIDRDRELIYVKGIDEFFEDIKGGHILLGIHAGNWEFFNAFFAKKYRYAILVKKQKNKALERLINEIRERSNIKVCFSLKQLVKYIKDNYWIGLVIDHGAEDKALMVNFFGALVPTPQGAVYLAKKFEKNIYPVFGYRNKLGKYTIEIEKGLDCKNEDLEEVLKKLNTIYEKFLTKHPENYVWWYKRFKKKKTLFLLILNDLKTGHFKQSLTLVNILKELKYEVKDYVVDIPNINRVKRLLLELCAFYTSNKCLGCMKCIKIILGKELYKKVSTIFVDMVISTGSKMAPINLILSRSMGAKAIVILKPNISPDRFDLGIIPEHDRVIASKVVNIKGALSFPFTAEDDKRILMERYNLKSYRRVALFIGGPLESSKLFFNNLKVFVPQLKKFIWKENFHILVTTSRRTPQFVSDFLENEFRDFLNTDVLTISSKDSSSFIVGGFLSLAEVSFVTSDSISMISESLSMGKTTVCVCLEEIFTTHHINFFFSINNIVNFLKPPYKIEGLKEPSYSIFEYNKRVVKEAVKRII